MKTTTLSVLLSIASLAAVGLLYVKVDDLGEQLSLQRSGRAAGERRAAETDPYARSDDRRDRDAEERRSSEPLASRAPGTTAPAAPTGTLEDRLARLERTDRERSSREKNASPFPRLHTQRFARNVKDLAKRLKLTQSQTDRMNDSFKRAKDRIDAVMSIPGADGRSPKEARQDRRRKLKEAMSKPDQKPSDFIALAMRGHARMQEKIPGRNETYADEIKRVKKETREEIGNDLSPEQKKEFDQTQVDHLMGGGSSGAQISFVTTSSDGGMGDGMVIGDHAFEIEETVEDPETDG